MSKREDAFLSFCSRALGTSPEAPLKEINGALVGGLVEAYKATRAPRRPVVPHVQTFTDAVYSQPWTVYVIRNKVTTAAYVGSSASGFLHRYPRGEWWLAHQNESLGRDAWTYGVRNFRVLVHVCTDRGDMHRVEADLIRANRPYTYNIRHEPDNRE